MQNVHNTLPTNCFHLTQNKKATEDAIKSGKHEAGVLFGASIPLINKMMGDIMDANPKLRPLIEKESIKVFHLIDAQLTGQKGVQDHERFEELKSGKTPPKKKDDPKKEDPKTPNDGTKPDKVKGGLKGFGTAAADAAKNIPSTTDKKGSLSSNNQGGGGNRSLTINKLVETLIVKVERLPESKERIKDAVAEALLTAVNDYNLAT